MYEKKLVLVVLSIFLVSCSSLKNEKIKIKETNEIKKENSDKKDKINIKDYSKIKKYVEIFNKKHNNSSKKFANANFLEKNKSFDIELLDQAKIDISSILTLKEKNPNKINENIKNLWKREILQFALDTSKEINDESIAINIINPKDKKSKIVTIKNNKILFDYLK